jgi:transcriptional regulator with XRE-family HTH domain
MDDDFAEKFKRLRKQNGLTQTDISVMTGLSVDSISRIENKQHKPRQATLKKLQKCLDMSQERLVSSKRSEKPQTESKRVKVLLSERTHAQLVLEKGGNQTDLDDVIEKILYDRDVLIVSLGRILRRYGILDSNTDAARKTELKDLITTCREWGDPKEDADQKLVVAQALGLISDGRVGNDMIADVLGQIFGKRINDEKEYAKLKEVFFGMVINSPRCKKIADAEDKGILPKTVRQMSFRLLDM